MGKIRINELARQLEVPSHDILDMLPKLGVTEKKTHSSSVEDEVAEQIRRVLFGEDGGSAREPADFNGTATATMEPPSEYSTPSPAGPDVHEPVASAPPIESRPAPASSIVVSAD